MGTPLPHSMTKFGSPCEVDPAPEIFGDSMPIFIGSAIGMLSPILPTTMLEFLQQVLYFSLHDAEVRLTLVLITDASLSIDQKRDWKPKDTSI